jgi:hypothetical protein
MAGMAWVILVAASELDGDNVQLGTVMNTPGKSVNRLAENQVFSNRDKPAQRL